MTDNNKEPIDLLKRRTEKLLDQATRKEETEEAKRQLEWSGAKFAAEIDSIRLSKEVVQGVKTFMCTIASKVKEARSIQEIERMCLGLALVLLRDYDRVAFDKLLEMVKDKVEKE